MPSPGSPTSLSRATEPRLVWSSACTSVPRDSCSRWGSCTRTIPRASTTTCGPWPDARIWTRAKSPSSWASSGRSSGNCGRGETGGSGVRRCLAEAVADHVDELFEIEGLENEVADGVGRNLVDAALAGSGEDDDVGTRVGVFSGDAVDELVAVDARHHEVEQDQVEGGVLPE